MTGTTDDGMSIGVKDLPQKFVLKVLGHAPTRGLWGLKHTREPVDKMVRFAKDNNLCLPIIRLIVTREGIFLLPVDPGGGKEKEEEEPDVRINVTVPRCEVECPRADGERDESKASRRCFRIKAHFRIVKHIDRRKGKKKLEEVLSNGNVCKGCGREREDKPAATNRELLEKYKRIDWSRHGVHFYPIDNISYGVQDLVYTRVFSMIEVTEPSRAPFVCHSFVCESHNTAKRLTHALDAAFQAYGKTLKDLRKNVDVTTPPRPVLPSL